MNRSTIFFLALGVTSLEPLQAAAATDSRYYLDADVGVNFEQGKVNLDVGPDVLHRVSNHQLDTMWGFSVGEQFTRHFALELGYRDLGRISGSLINVPGSNPATGSFGWSAHGPTTTLVWRFPVGRWEADFKLGSLFAYSHVSAQVTDGFGSYTRHVFAWNPGWLAEIGLGYRLTDHWTVSLREDAFGKIGREEIKGRWSVRATLLGVSYNF